MNSFSRLARTVLAGSAATVFCTVAFAQTTPVIQTFSQETTLPFSQIAFAGTPNITPDVLASITSGAMEVRQVIEQRSDGTLHVRHLLVQRGAPNPTPANMQMAVLEDYIVRVNSVVQWADVSATPPGTTTTGSTNTGAGSITFIGTVTDEYAVSPFGSLRNMPFIYSIGYTQPAAGSTSTATTFRNATLIIPGRLTTFIQSGTGTLLWSGQTPGGGGGTPTGPSIGIADRIQTLDTNITLNAMATDASGGPLTYMWTVVKGTAIVLDPTSANPRVQVPRVFGEHTLEVTVTNAAGQSTTKQFVIFYQGTGSF